MWLLLIPIFAVHDEMVFVYTAHDHPSQKETCVGKSWVKKDVGGAKKMINESHSMRNDALLVLSKEQETENKSFKPAIFQNHWSEVNQS